MLTSENIELALEAFNDVRCSGSEPVRYETPRTLESFVCDRAPEHLTAASQIHPVLAYPVMLGKPASMVVPIFEMVVENSINRSFRFGKTSVVLPSPAHAGTLPSGPTRFGY